MIVLQESVAVQCPNRAEARDEGVLLVSQKSEVSEPVTTRSVMDSCEYHDLLPSSPIDQERLVRSISTNPKRDPPMATMTSTRQPEEYLRIYLNDHRSGAVAGGRLAQRCRGNNADSDLGRYLATLVDEVHEDAATLDEIMQRFGVRANPIKHALAVIGELIARLKLNGHLRGYSPLSRVIELETLIAGVHAKQQLWEALKAARCDVPAGVLDEMTERADRQLQALEAFHRTAAIHALASSTVNE